MASRKRAAASGPSSTIGAMTSLSKVERSDEVARFAPVVVRTMRRLSNVRVRNVATVGGNLAHGDPHMDLPPVLIALGAEVAVTGPKQSRRIAVEDLFAGYFETVLRKNELISELRIPAARQIARRLHQSHHRIGRGLARSGRGGLLEQAGSAIKSARVVVSAATEKAMRLPAAEEALAGADANEHLSRGRGRPRPTWSNASRMCAARRPTNASL